MKLIDNNNFIKKALAIVFSVIIIIGRSTTSSGAEMKLKNIPPCFTLTASASLEKLEKLAAKTNLKHKESKKFLCLLNYNTDQTFHF